MSDAITVTYDASEAALSQNLSQAVVFPVFCAILSGDMMSDDNDFLRPRTVRVSPEALAYAREFAETIGSVQGGSWIVSFDWSTSMIEHTPGEPDREHGPCLSLGAYRRREVPVAVRDCAAGMEFTISIPKDVLEQFALKRIDLDDGKLFRLVLS